MADADEKTESIFQKVKDKAKDVQTTVTEKIAGVADSGMEKLMEMIPETDEIQSLIRELGYTVEGIVVGVGLIPDIAIEISGLTKTMDEETYNRMLEEHKNEIIIISVLKTLQTASALQHKITIMGMRSDSATITLGLSPKINLKFKKIDDPESV
jgi:hypothetical protein